MKEISLKVSSAHDRVHGHFQDGSEPEQLVLIRSGIIDQELLITDQRCWTSKTRWSD